MDTTRNQEYQADFMGAPFDNRSIPWHKLLIEPMFFLDVSSGHPGAHPLNMPLQPGFIELAFPGPDPC